MVFGSLSFSVCRRNLVRVCYCRHMYVGYPESPRGRTGTPSECSPRFEALLATRDGPFRLVLPLPCPPASTSPGEGLPRGLCGRHERRNMQNRINVGTFMPGSEHDAHPKAVWKKTSVVHTIADDSMMCAVCISH